MQISKVATAVALSTGLLFGCNSDGLPIPTDGSTDPATPTSALLNGYWEFSDTAAFSAAYSSSSSDDLPNVYRFSADGETLYYYTDNSADTTLGEYERFKTTYEETIDDETSGQVAFTLFNDDGTVSSVSVDGDYSAADGGLAIGGNIPVSGTDHSDNTEVTGPADTADEASGVDNAAQILDTLTDDTGELRLKILNTSSTVGKTISSGKLTVDLTYQLNPDSEQVDEGQNNSYISLYSTNDEDDKVSNAYHHGDIAIGDGNIQFRDASGSLTSTGGTFDANSTFDATVEVVWTPTSHTFTINGEKYTGAVSSNSSGEVQVIALRLGTNSGVTPYELIADNLKVYSLDESSGEYVEEFKDNFNDYSVGYDLNNSPYNSSTSEATVISLSGEAPVDPENPEPPVGDFPVALNEYTFDNADYTTDSGSADNDLTSKSGSPLITTTSGAAGTGAMHIDQDTDTGGGFGYVYYNATSETTTGAQAITGSFSVETVIKADRFGYDSDVSLVDFAETSDYLGFKLYLEKDDNSIKFKVYGGKDTEGVGLSTEAKSSEGDVFLVKDNWYHILATYNHLDSTANLYIDGTLVHSKSVDFNVVENTTDDKFILLGGSSSSDKNFDGSVDNIAVWNDVLTDDQIQERVAQFTAE
ncbi:LamG domain-containing protein [Vibrio splendidus]|uniref:LamG domain-containing protein n=1 Tax=Vibrio splendidus TaxID=29497 RepID=UPI001FB2B143|nr:LamG domain-containing protein [Vibrio splendidus]UOE79471.1 LamG domain-containing protein [Vibrio splendidus]